MAYVFSTMRSDRNPAIGFNRTVSGYSPHVRHWRERWRAVWRYGTCV